MTVDITATILAPSTNLSAERHPVPKILCKHEQRRGPSGKEGMRRCSDVDMRQRGLGMRCSSIVWGIVAVCMSTMELECEYCCHLWPVLSQFAQQGLCVPRRYFHATATLRQPCPAATRRAGVTSNSADSGGHAGHLPGWRALRSGFRRFPGMPARWHVSPMQMRLNTSSDNAYTGALR